MLNLELSKALLEDSNCWHRRFFRCYIDGSYNGEEHYRENCRYVRRNYDDDKRLRMLAISEFVNFMCREFECSYSSVQRHMVKTFTKGQLELLNEELIDDLRDLVREEMEEA